MDKKKERFKMIDGVLGLKGEVVRGVCKLRNIKFYLRETCNININ